MSQQNQQIRSAQESEGIPPQILQDIQNTMSFYNLDPSKRYGVVRYKDMKDLADVDRKIELSTVLAVGTSADVESGMYYVVDIDRFQEFYEEVLKKKYAPFKPNTDYVVFKESELSNLDKSAPGLREDVLRYSIPQASSVEPEQKYYIERGKLENVLKENKVEYKFDNNILNIYAKQYDEDRKYVKLSSDTIRGLTDLGIEVKYFEKDGEKYLQHNEFESMLKKYGLTEADLSKNYVKVTPDIENMFKELGFDLNYKLIGNSKFIEYNTLVDILKKSGANVEEKDGNIYIKYKGSPKYIVSKELSEVLAERGAQVKEGSELKKEDLLNILEKYNIPYSFKGDSIEIAPFKTNVYEVNEDLKTFLSKYGVNVKVGQKFTQDEFTRLLDKYGVKYELKGGEISIYDVEGRAGVYVVNEDLKTFLSKYGIDVRVGQEFTPEEFTKLLDKYGVKYELKGKEINIYDVVEDSYESITSKVSVYVVNKDLKTLLSKYGIDVRVGQEFTPEEFTKLLEKHGVKYELREDEIRIYDTTSQYIELNNELIDALVKYAGVTQISKTMEKGEFLKFLTKHGLRYSEEEGGIKIYFEPEDSLSTISTKYLPKQVELSDELIEGLVEAGVRELPPRQLSMEEFTSYLEKHGIKYTVDEGGKLILHGVPVKPKPGAIPEILKSSGSELDKMLKPSLTPTTQTTYTPAVGGIPENPVLNALNLPSETVAKGYELRLKEYKGNPLMQGLLSLGAGMALGVTSIISPTAFLEGIQSIATPKGREEIVQSVTQTPHTSIPFIVGSVATSALATYGISKIISPKTTVAAELELTQPKGVKDLTIVIGKSGDESVFAAKVVEHGKGTLKPLQQIPKYEKLVEITATKEDIKGVPTPYVKVVENVYSKPPQVGVVKASTLVDEPQRVFKMFEPTKVSATTIDKFGDAYYKLVHKSYDIPEQFYYVEKTPSSSKIAVVGESTVLYSKSTPLSTKDILIKYDVKQSFLDKLRGVVTWEEKSLYKHAGKITPEEWNKYVEIYSSADDFAKNKLHQHTLKQLGVEEGGAASPNKVIEEVKRIDVGDVKNVGGSQVRGSQNQVTQLIQEAKAVSEQPPKVIVTQTTQTTASVPYISSTQFAEKIRRQQTMLMEDTALEVTSYPPFTPKALYPMSSPIDSKVVPASLNVVSSSSGLMQYTKQNVMQDVTLNTKLTPLQKYTPTPISTIPRDVIRPKDVIKVMEDGITTPRQRLELVKQDVKTTPIISQGISSIQSEEQRLKIKTTPITAYVTSPTTTQTKFTPQTLKLKTQPTTVTPIPSIPRLGVTPRTPVPTPTVTTPTPPPPTTTPPTPIPTYVRPTFLSGGGGGGGDMSRLLRLPDILKTSGRVNPFEKNLQRIESKLLKSFKLGFSSPFGLLSIIISALVTLFVSVVIFWILFPSLLPAILNTMDNYVASNPSIPADIVNMYVNIKDIINRVIWAMPLILIIAVGIFIVTRSAQREEDIY